MVIQFTMTDAAAADAIEQKNIKKPNLAVAPEVAGAEFPSSVEGEGLTKVFNSSVHDLLHDLSADLPPPSFPPSDSSSSSSLSPPSSSRSLQLTVNGW